MQPPDLALLRARWDRTLAPSSPPPAASTAVFDELVEAYSAPQRHYHTLGHVEACLSGLDALFPETPRREPLELAFWFHDAVYDTRASDNEAKSADLARARLVGALGLSAELGDEVANLVLATNHARAPKTPAETIVLDVDLAILGESPETYARYERLVRLEYEWVSEYNFRWARAAVLRHFADRPKVYVNAVMSERGYERRARENLRRSLESLAPPPG